MAESQKSAGKYKKTARNAFYKFEQAKTTAGRKTDEYANEVQKLYSSGRRNRGANPVVAAPVAKAGGGGKIGLDFSENGQIAKMPSLLDRPNVKARKPLADWCATLKAADAAAEEATDLIKPTKINAQINDKLELIFDKDENSFFKQFDNYPALLEAFMRVVVGVMEKFCQEATEIKLIGKRVQLVLSCKMINSSEKGYQSESKQEPEDVVISTNYLVSVGDSPKLRIVFQDVDNIEKSDITHDLNQDTFTLWHNELYLHRIEAQGAGEAVLLSIGLVSPDNVWED